MSNFQPLEVVDRGSETQPQVVENLNNSTNQDKDGPFNHRSLFYLFFHFLLTH